MSATNAKQNSKELTDKLISVLSKPIAHEKNCKVCGNKFYVNTDNSEVENCMTCQIKIDLKLDDDCIINYNIVNLWKAGRYDKVKGIDPFLCSVAEGIMLLPEDVKNRTHLTIVTSIKRKIPNNEIDSYTKKLVRRINGRYDAILFLRFNAKEDFSIFRIKLSNRLYDKLTGRDTKFIKKFMISLAVKNVLKKAKKK